MKKTEKKLKKPPKRNQATVDLLESLAEMQSYANRGMTIDDMKRDIQRRHPQRVRVVFHAPDPGKYPPVAIKRLRNAMAMSQATFAQVIGVSRILVQSWERGVREPSPLACRLLDTISCRPIRVAGAAAIAPGDAKDRLKKCPGDCRLSRIPRHSALERSFHMGTAHDI